MERMASAIRSSIRCRLCGGETQYLFSHTVLKTNDVGYYRCVDCGSLQTIEPTWLDEAYADSRRALDTGGVARNQRNQRLVYFLAGLFGLGPADKVLDWGAGDGLFVRMLRDVGLDAYWSDRYADNFYAPFFTDDGRRTYALITAFEVWEHLANPSEEIDLIFRRGPDIHLLSTELYRGQGAEWRYLWPATGRHVFFFSPVAMDWIAKKYGYQVISGSANYTVFHRRFLSPVRRRLLKLLLDGKQSRAWDVRYALARKKSLIEKDRDWVIAHST
jgi:Methyltransferase domain